MKLGLILECAPGGSDQQVFEHFLEVLNPKIEVASRTLVNKARLKAECGKAAKELLEDGCKRIGIVWDLFPPWREKKPGDEHCRGRDREDICKSLVAAGVGGSPIELICITEELEAWMLSDERALNLILGRPTHKANERRIKFPEQVNNPKKHLRQLYERHGRGHYNDMVDAIRIAKAMPDLNRIVSCPSFIRFAERLARVNLAS